MLGVICSSSFLKAMPSSWRWTCSPCSCKISHRSAVPVKIFLVFSVGADNMDRWGVRADTEELLQCPARRGEGDCLRASRPRRDWQQPENASAVGGRHLRDDHLQGAGEGEDGGWVSKDRRRSWVSQVQGNVSGSFLYRSWVPEVIGKSSSWDDTRELVCDCGILCIWGGFFSHIFFE